MGGLNVIMSSDFYQVPPVQNSRMFSSKKIRFNILTTIFWHENFKCYELHKIMKQNDVHFVNILNRFQTTSQTNENIHLYLRPPSTHYHIYFTQTLKPIPITKLHITKHLVKYLNFLQNIFILKHVHFISNYHCYHLTLVVSIIN
jgi:hypothetical protein